MPERDYIDEVDLSSRFKDKRVILESDDLPITLVWEGRKEYCLKTTKNDKLVLTNKE